MYAKNDDKDFSLAVNASSIYNQLKDCFSKRNTTALDLKEVYAALSFYEEYEVAKCLYFLFIQEKIRIKNGLISIITGN